jgi:hypothetical protein
VIDVRSKPSRSGGGRGGVEVRREARPWEGEEREVFFCWSLEEAAGAAACICGCWRGGTGAMSRWLRESQVVTR